MKCEIMYKNDLLRGETTLYNTHFNMNVIRENDVLRHNCCYIYFFCIIKRLFVESRIASNLQSDCQFSYSFRMYSKLVFPIFLFNNKKKKIYYKYKIMWKFVFNMHILVAPLNFSIHSAGMTTWFSIGKFSANQRKKNGEKN